MKIENVIEKLESLVSESPNNRVRKRNKKFLEVLEKLMESPLTEMEMKKVELALDAFQDAFEGVFKRVKLKRAMIKFETFLNEQLSLVTSGHYARQGLILGSSFGMLFGLVVFSHFENSQGMLVGSFIGIVIGMVIGRQMDEKAVAEGRVL